MKTKKQGQTWPEILRSDFKQPRIQKETSLPEAVNIILTAVAAHLKKSKHIRAYLEGMQKDPANFCHHSPIDELVRYVAIQEGRVDKSDPRLNLNFMREVIMPVFNFEREQVLSAVNQILDASDVERHCLKTGAVIGEAVDGLWARWFEQVVVPYQSLGDKERRRYKEVVKDYLTEPDYTVFDFDAKSGAIFNRRAWALAFPEETKKIVIKINSLLRPADPPLADYLRALSAAYACEDIKKLNVVWKEADDALIRIPSDYRAFFVHGMSGGYEHPFCVSPEFRLEVRVSEDEETIHRIRVATIAYTYAINLEDGFNWQFSRQLERIDAGIFVAALRSGVCLNFYSSGQSIPEPLSGKIFLSRAHLEGQASHARRNIERHCLPQAAQILKENITPELFLLDTAAHECAHLVGWSREIETALGAENSLLDEAKATAYGLLVNEWQAGGAPEHRLALVALTIARVFNLLHTATMNDPTSAPYVREAKVLAGILLKSGVIRITREGVDVNAEKARKRVWFDELKKFVVAVVAAYRDKDREALKKIYRQYGDPDKYAPLANIISWINRF